MRNEQQEDYTFFSKKVFYQLANKHDAECISIYIPTHRSGKEVEEGKDILTLKNCLKKVSSKLEKYGNSKQDVAYYLRPIELLLDEGDFWRSQSDGLAIFLNNEGMRYYKLPISFKEYLYVSDHFYLKPLIPFFNGNGKFLLLTLSQKEVKLFEGNRNYLTEVEADLIPQNTEEVVGEDYEQKNLNFRSNQNSGEHALFHGHGEGKEDRKAEISRFFRAVDRAVLDTVNDTKLPLLLACEEQNYPIYRKVSKYKNLFPEFISKNPKQIQKHDLHKKAWDTIKSHFSQERKNKLDEFKNAFSSTKVSTEFKDIIPAAVDGRVDTLFIEATKEIYGLYDKENRSVIVDESEQPGNASLINLAATHSFLQGAKVYLVYPDDMPVTGTTLNALFRY